MFVYFYDKYLACLIAVFAALLPAHASAKLKVVTSSSDLASIASYVGGELVEVESLTPGNTDLHYVSARPDFIRKVNQADVFVIVGLDLELGWVPLVLRQSRNSAVQPGGKGYVDASKGIRPLGIPEGEIDRSMGDIHALGNPHYWTDPVRAVVIARNISNALKVVDATNAKIYESQFESFRKKAMELAAELEKKFRPHRGRKVLAYHNEFTYFAERFGFEIAGHIEERPGVAPSTRHIRSKIQRVKDSDIKLIINSPWSNLSHTQRVAKEAEIEHIILPIQVGASEGTDDWFAMLRTSAKILADAFAKTSK